MFVRIVELCKDAHKWNKEVKIIDPTLTYGEQNVDKADNTVHQNNIE